MAPGRSSPASRNRGSRCHRTTPATRTVLRLVLFGCCFLATATMTFAADSTSTGTSTGTSSSISSSSSSSSGSSSSSSAMKTCDQSTVALLRHDTAANQALQAAVSTYENAMESTVNGKEWSFVFPASALDDYKAACTAYNDANDGTHRNGVWVQQQQQQEGDGDGDGSTSASASVTYTCDMPQMNVQGKPVTFSNIGECLANTSECRSVTAEDLIKKLYERVGFVCNTGGGDGDATANANDNDNDNGAAEKDTATVEKETATATATETTQDPDDKETNDDEKTETTNDTKGDSASSEGGTGSSSSSSSSESSSTTKDNDSDGDGNNSGGGSEGSGTSSTTTTTNNSDNSSSSSNNNNMLTPGDQNTDTSQSLPFLTDDDKTCLAATAAFHKQNPGLQSAEDTYKQDEYTKVIRDTGRQVMGYPWASAQALRAACELHNGYWDFVQAKNFTCVVQGTETLQLGVVNFGTCLSKADECEDMDPTNPLLEALADEKIACWADDSGDDSDNDSDNDTDEQEDSTNDSAKDNTKDNTEDEVDADADADADAKDDEDDNSDGADAVKEDGDGDTDGTNDNGNDSDDDGDGDSSKEGDSNDNGNDNGDGDGHAAETDTESQPQSQSQPHFWDGTNTKFSESDKQCMDDSVAMNDAHPQVKTAIRAFGKTMNADMSDVENMRMGFADKDVEVLRQACEGVGYFTNVEEDQFICGMLSVEEHIKVTNIANCIADTEDCKNMDPLLLMEIVWRSMGIQCEEESKPSNTTTTSEDNDGNNDSNNDSGSSSSSGQDDALAQALGLTESEVACMSNSTAFIEGSEVLLGASKEYEKSVQMTDPTRLGYSKEAASKMEAICTNQGGLWSMVQSQDVTCTIHGRDRCIHVYNFGNCIASDDHCQTMDPMVLVRGFFLEVLGFDCRAECHDHKEGHAPTAAPHFQSPTSHNTNNNHFSPPTTSQSQSQGFGAASSQNSNATTSYTTAAVLLCLVTGLGFFGFYRYRASHRREKIPEGDMEMADISDLRFESLT